MTDDRQFLRLSDRCPRTYDRRQWIVQKFAGGKWRGVSFVTSDKGVLMRVLREAGATPLPAPALAALDTLPATFREFISDPNRVYSATWSSEPSPSGFSALSRAA